jgi:hypothetical protein
MTGFQGDAQAGAGGERYRALLAISEAIISHRDLEALFQELAGRLHQLVRFDYVVVVLHEAATNTMRLYVAGIVGGSEALLRALKEVETLAANFSPRSPLYFLLSFSFFDAHRF